MITAAKLARAYLALSSEEQVKFNRLVKPAKRQVKAKANDEVNPAEEVIAELIELLDSKAIKVVDIAKAAGVSSATASCYVRGVCLPKADKLPNLIKLAKRAR